MIVYKFYSANIVILFGKRKRPLQFFDFLYCVSQKLLFASEKLYHRDTMCRRGMRKSRVVWPHFMAARGG